MGDYKSVSDNSPFKRDLECKFNEAAFLAEAATEAKAPTKSDNNYYVPEVVEMYTEDGCRWPPFGQLCCWTAFTTVLKTRVHLTVPS